MRHTEKVLQEEEKEEEREERDDNNWISYKCACAHVIACE